MSSIRVCLYVRDAQTGDVLLAVRGVTSARNSPRGSRLYLNADNREQASMGVGRKGGRLETAAIVAKSIDYRSDPGPRRRLACRVIVKLFLLYAGRNLCVTRAVNLLLKITSVYSRAVCEGADIEIVP